MARIDEILEKLKDNAHAVVDIPGVNDESYRFNALLIKRTSPELELLFPPESWKISDLKIGASCNLAIEQNDATVNLIARLDFPVDARRLHFTAREPVSPESLRDYFRVLTNVPIEASYVAGPKEINTQSWKMLGTTIDLSGSGVLAMFAEKPASNHRIQLVISPPEERNPIICLGNVVKAYRIRKNRYQVAFHFEHISTKTRDQVISYCLQEQRRQLRENLYPE